MSERARLLGALGEGVVENFDPELKRAFDVADNEVAPELRDPEKLKFHEGQLKLSGDGIFYTLQGEGPTMGEPATFVRTHICNLRCVWSIAEGTLVTMSDGTQKPIEQIKRDDFVLSYKDKRFTVSRVLGTSSYKKQVVKISTEEGKSIYATPEHQFYTNHHKSGTDRSRADGLNGRYLKASEVSNIEKTEETKNFLIGYLKGALVGGGSINDGYSGLHLYFQVTDIDFIEKLKEIMDRLGFKSSITVSKRKTVIGKLVYRLSSSKRRLIEPLMEGPQNEEQEKGFIAGFFDAEGNVRPRQLVLSQQDWKTVERVVNLLDKYNFNVKVDKRKRAYGMVINGKEEIDRFFKLFPTFIKRKQKSFYEVNRALKAVKVIRVEPAEEKMVFDISTSVGNFFAENYLTANCNAWYTWNPKSEEFWTEPRDVDVKEVAQEIRESWQPTNEEVQKRVVFTGGEPMIQQDEIVNVAKELGNDWKVEIETNGTIMPSQELLDLDPQFNCSPKLKNSMNSRLASIRPGVLRELAKHNTAFKFVVMKPEELDEIENDFLKPYDLPAEKVILMPQGVTAEEVRVNGQKVAEYAKEKGFRLLGRLQTDLWGAKRRV